MPLRLATASITASLVTLVFALAPPLWPAIGPPLLLGTKKHNGRPSTPPPRPAGPRGRAPLFPPPSLPRAPPPAQIGEPGVFGGRPFFSREPPRVRPPILLPPPRRFGGRIRGP